MVSYTVICCPQGAPNCGNYCFDYSTFWSEITDCIHSAATKMKMYYYYKRLEGTQKFLTTYLVDSSNMTFILLTHHSLWPKKKNHWNKSIFLVNENEQGSFWNGSSNNNGLQDVSNPFTVDNKELNWWNWYINIGQIFIYPCMCIHSISTCQKKEHHLQIELLMQMS